MDYSKSEQIRQIQIEINRAIRDYFKQCDLIFRDYIYGDPYYQTLTDLSYSFLNRWGMGYSIDCQPLGMIDIVQVVSELYAVFIKADKKCKNKKTALSDRHRKNYIHKALRNATWRKLKKQYKRYIIFTDNQEDLETTLQSNLKRFRYVSLDVYEDDSLADQLSYDRWVSDTEAFRDGEAKKDAIREMMTILNSVEIEVIDLALDGFIYAEMAGKMNLTTEQIGKIFYRAKTKLVNYYNQN